ncbi:MAG TPA: tyrosine-type recombinase/integrase [Galbitalea sp.]|jgi:integrase|nr:tyrosine-type recombinase/integrase [Galbitalea sp.]
MPTRRGDKWEGRLKLAGRVVKTRRFDTKRAAAEWERRQRSAFDEHGYDPSRGKVSAEALLAIWLEQRAKRVSRTTLNTDRFLLPTPGQQSGRSSREPILPMWFRKLHIVKVTGASVEKWQDDLLARGLAPTSVKRHRESLSSFFTWCVSEGYIAFNPVKSTAPPRDRRARERMRPLPAPELDEVVKTVAKVSPVYADLVRVLARTGLRWGEARAMLVRDCSEVPMPMLSVIRNQPEGVPTAQTPKSGTGRRVPLPDALLPAIRRFVQDKSPDELLFTRPGGGQLHRSMFIRQTGWATAGRGRTLHDLRHTAACEWILQGVPLTTVQAWLGHSSIEITSRYLHHLGDFADRSALQLINEAAASAPSERAKKVPDRSAFGRSVTGTRAPDRGISR